MTSTPRSTEVHAYILHDMTMMVIVVGIHTYRIHTHAYSYIHTCMYTFIQTYIHQHEDFSEGYAKDLVATKKKLVECDTKIAALEKQVVHV